MKNKCSPYRKNLNNKKFHKNLKITVLIVAIVKEKIPIINLIIKKKKNQVLVLCCWSVFLHVELFLIQIEKIYN